MRKRLVQRDGREWHRQTSLQHHAPLHRVEQLRDVGMARVVSALSRQNFGQPASTVLTSVSTTPTIRRSSASSEYPAPLMNALRRKRANSSSP